MFRRDTFLREAEELRLAMGWAYATLSKKLFPNAVTYERFLKGETSPRLDTLEKADARLHALRAESRIGRGRGVSEPVAPLLDNDVEEIARLDTSKGKAVLQISIPKRMLEYADELGVDAEAFVLKGGLPALDAELKRVFYEQNAEAIESSRKRIAEHGTFGQRFGVYRFQ